MENAVDAKVLYDRLERVKPRGIKFGENLESLRVKRGYSRKTFAELIGMTEIAYGAYERGARQPTLEKIFKIADTLQIPVGELFGDDEKNNVFEYRMRRASRLAKLAGYPLTLLGDNKIELEIPGDKKYDEKGNYTQWTRVIPFKTFNDFVEITEMAGEKAVEQNVTFDAAFKNIISDADKVFERNWRAEVDEYVKKFGVEKLLAMLKGAKNENDVSDVAQET